MVDDAADHRRRHGGFVAAVILLAFVTVLGAVAVAIVLVPTDRPVTLTLDRDVAADALAVPIAVEERVPGGEELLTSDRFVPAITFRVRSMPDGSLHPEQAEFCFKESDEHVIVFQHLMGCVDEVRLIHPFAVDCGGLILEPTAANVAAAMLARPDLGAADLGPLRPGVNVHEDLLDVPATGRVISTVHGEPFFRDAGNPDACRLLPPPGSDADPIEIRRDMTERYVLIDHDGGLVIVRVGTAGHDAVSGQAGYERGYGFPDSEGLDHMLRGIYDIGFE